VQLECGARLMSVTVHPNTVTPNKLVVNATNMTPKNSWTASNKCVKTLANGVLWQRNCSNN
jgi:hypothetical protein